MTTIVASGIGGPILLLLTGCVVRSGVWWKWHWNWFLTSGDILGSINSQGNTGHLWVHLPRRFVLLGWVRVDRQGITLAAHVMMASMRSLSFRRVSRLIWTKTASPIEHTSALKVLRSKAQCPTRLKPRIRGTNTLDHTNVGALGGTIPHTLAPLWFVPGNRERIKDTKRQTLPMRVSGQSLSEQANH